jgi:hypothetical protein
MPPNEPRAIRLTFSYTGSDIRLTAAQRLTLFVPPSDPLGPLEGQSGFWVEVRGPRDLPLFRRLMHPPIQPDYEVFPDKPGGQIVRSPRAAPPAGVFTVIVPDLPDAHYLVFHGSQPTAQHRHLAAQELARFDLRNLPTHPEDCQP